jgi:hypothetical protein
VLQLADAALLLVALGDAPEGVPVPVQSRRRAATH